MAIILPANTLSAGGYEVANSCRMNHGDDPIFTKTKGTPTLSTKFTWSGWVKRSRLGDDQVIANHWKDSSNYGYFYFRNGDDIRFFDRHGTGDGTDTVWISNSLFRDVSAWMHIFIKCDTTQATDTNRFKIFINGVQDTGNGITYPAEDATMAFNMSSASNRTVVGGSGDGYNYLGGYLSEIVFIDGTAYDHTDLGEFDEDSPTIWKPKDPSTLTFGDEGYYMDFEDSDNLGDDESGNASDFTETNVVAGDQATDSPTNNFSTINSLDNYFYAATLSEGNLKQTANASNYTFGTSTFGVSSGKWVVEVKIGGSTLRNALGITDKVSTGTTNQLGDLANGWQYGANGTVYNSGSDIGGSYDTYTTNDIIGIYLDLDNNKLYYAKNGTVQNSGTGISITAPSSITNGVYFIAFGDYGASDDSVNEVNFGSPPYANSSSVTDGEYGAFEYSTTITGDSASKTFKALNSANLSEFG